MQPTLTNGRSEQVWLGEKDDLVGIVHKILGDIICVNFRDEDL